MQLACAIWPFKLPTVSTHLVCVRTGWSKGNKNEKDGDERKTNYYKYYFLFVAFVNVKVKAALSEPAI